MAGPKDGTYIIFNAANVNLALDTSGASRGNGANVRVVNYKAAGDGHIFELESNGDGTYRIMSRFSGKSIDVSGGKMVDGQNVQQWTGNGNRNQRWEIADSGATVSKWGTARTAYEIYSKRLEVVRSATGNGTCTLADCTAGKPIVHLKAMGACSEGAAVESISVGDASVQLPTYLASVPSGICDIADFDADTGLTVQRNVGVVDNYNADTDAEAIGTDWTATEVGADGMPSDGARVYFALQAQDEGIEEAVDEAGIELEDNEPVGAASIESYPTCKLPDVPSAGCSVTAPNDAALIVDYWGVEAAEENLYMTAASASSGANVSIRKSASVSNAAQRRWVLAPVPEFESGACYELHSYANNKLVLSSNGTANGANSYMLMDSDSNTQRWILNEASDGKWTIQNVKSRRFLSVSGGKARNGQNVQIWNGNSSNAQKWYIDEYGTTKYNGASCPIVKLVSWVTDPTDASKTHYNLDVNGASKSVLNKSNVCIYQNDDSADQRWVLVRTTAVDTSLGVPDSLTASRSPGAGGGLNHGIYGGKHTFYPYWQMADNWLATGSANNYQIRWRTRYMDADTGKWGAWSAYNAWRTANCKIVDKYSDVKRRGKGGWAGEQAWFLDGISVELDIRDREDADGNVIQGTKAVEVQYGVRAVGAGSASNVVSRDAYCVLRGTYAPETELTEAVWTPSGYRLVFATDYDKGQWSILLDELVVNGVKVVSKTVEYKGLSGFSGTANVDMNLTTGTIYRQGASVTAKWRVRTDLGVFGKTYTGATRLKWNTNHSEDAAPKIVHSKSAWVDTVTVNHSNGAKARLWARWHINDGYRFFEVAGKSSGTSTVFSVAPPEHAYQLWTTVTANNDAWSTSFTTVPDRNELKRHIWTNGTTLIAQLAVRRNEQMELSGRLSADADTLKLSKRAYDVVRFGATRKMEVTVEGECYNPRFDASDAKPKWVDRTDAKLAGYAGIHALDIRKLVGRHLVYRSPWGDRWNVAVTDVSFTERRDGVSATVSMIVEGM